MTPKDKDKNGDEENYEDNDENKETQKEKDEDKEKHKDKDMERNKDNNGDNEKRNDKDNHEDCLVLSESNASNQIKRKVLLVKMFFLGFSCIDIAEQTSLFKGFLPTAEVSGELVFDDDRLDPDPGRLHHLLSHHVARQQQFSSGKQGIDCYGQTRR